MKRKVHVAIPINPDTQQHHKDITVWIGKALENKEYKKKYSFDWNFRDEKVIDNNRNRIVQDFLSTDADYLLFMDADNPPFKDPIPLVDLDKDVMACPTPVWNAKRFSQGGFPLYFNCMDAALNGWVEHTPRVGLQEIDAAGTGCMIIARRVLEHPDMVPPFVRQWDEKGQATKGSDFEFCRRAKEAGFTIWAHYDYLCHHMKSVDLLTIFKIMRLRDVSMIPLENPNTQEYWDEQWSSRGERILPFYKQIAERVNGHRVLDFGCGRGDLLALLGERAEGMDISSRAVEVCRERGLKAEVGDSPRGQYDLIVCTEVLEHLDNDREVYESFFEHAPEVIFSVPNDCLPPGLEPEHRRVYTIDTVKSFPHVTSILVSGDYLVAHARKETNDGE